MPLTYELVIGPASEPVTLDEVKGHLHITGTDEDIELTLYLEAARRDVELFLHRQLMPATWKLYCDGFPRVIRLPHSPINSITSVTYLDMDGNSQTLGTTVYQTDLISEPPMILLAEGQNWPSVQSGTINTVQVTYVAGYADAAAVPAPIKLAILQQVGDMYVHRETQLDIAGTLRSITENPTTMRLLARYQIPFLV